MLEFFAINSHPRGKYDGLSVGWSDFALERHLKGTGNSYFTCSHRSVDERVFASWDRKYPGQGETCLTRKIVVPIDPSSFFTSLAPLQVGMPVRAAVTTRQEGEDPYVETFISTEDADRLGVKPIGANFVNIVLYSHETLIENGGKAFTKCDWEVVAVLASEREIEPMPPLTMSRNYLEKAGGTKSIYTAQEFAEAIYFNSQKGIKIKDLVPSFILDQFTMDKDEKIKKLEKDNETLKEKLLKSQSNSSSSPYSLRSESGYQTSQAEEAYRTTHGGR